MNHVRPIVMSSLLTFSLSMVGPAHAQVVTAVKETAKATAEGAQQAGNQVKSVVESSPQKEIDRAKARAHKARAKAHLQNAKSAAKAAIK